MDFRYHILKIINWAVLIVPFCFSKKMVFIANDFFHLINRRENQLSKEYEAIKTYSLLEPRLNWKIKAVSSVCTLSAKQVNRLHQWKKRTDLHRFRPIDKASINDNGWVNLGNFKTNLNRRHDIDISLGKDSEYIDSCNVCLFGFSNGTYYLSIYWYLSDKATLLVKDVDVSQLKNTEIRYFTCNPFNRDYGLTTYISKVSLCNEVILNGLNAINKEVDILEKRLKHLISVKTSSKSVRNLDILVKEDEPYFWDENTFKKLMGERKKNKSEQGYRFDQFALVRNPQPPVFTVYENFEKQEFLLNHIQNFQDQPFGQIFIKSEKLTPEKLSDMAYATYEHMPCHILDSHNAFAVYQLFNQKFNQLNDKYADFILNTSVEAEKQYDAMYNAFIEIDAIERQITSTISSASRLSFENHNEKYMNTLFQYCSNTLNRVSEVKQDIEQKKTNSNELVQAGNLTYQKRNSQLVVLLAIIQIILAYLALNHETTQKIIGSVSSFFSFMHSLLPL